MNKRGRNYQFYLEDMLDSMERIMEYTDDLTFNEFRGNNLVSDAVIRNLEIVGEATKNVPERIRKKYPAIPWKEMYGLRNFVVMNISELTMIIFGKLSLTNYPKIFMI